MPAVASKLAVELDLIGRVYRKPILSGRGVCTLSPYNQFLVEEARRRQTAYFHLTKTLEKQEFALDLVHWAEQQGWEFVVRYDDGGFGLMPDDAKREKVQRLLGERPRVRNLVVPPPPIGGEVVPPPPPMNGEAIRGGASAGEDDDDDDEAASESLSYHSVGNISPIHPEVDSQRHAPSDASLASSNASWNDNGSLSILFSEPWVALSPYDDGGEDLGIEAEVDTVALPFLMDNEETLMEIENGDFSVESGWISLEPLEIDQLWDAFAATSPVGMDVSF